MKTIIRSFIIGTFLVGLSACNNAAPEQTEEKSAENMDNKTEVIDESKMDHQEMNHSKESTMVPGDGTDLLPIPEGARVFFTNLKDGDKVNSPVHIEFGVEGMEVEPAGQLAQNKGHHHIQVDGSFIERGKVVPTSETSIHYGKGQTQTQLELSSGAHTLTLQFADGVHQSYGEQMSATISIVVE